MSEKPPSNVVEFPNPLTREEALVFAETKGWEHGALLVINDICSDIIVIGNPTNQDLLWLAERLRLRAMMPDIEEEYCEDGEIS